MESMIDEESRGPLTGRTLRQFAAVWIVFFGALAVVAVWRRGDYAAGVVLGTLALGVGVPGLAFPEFLRPIYLGWSALVRPIGWMVSQLLIGSLFYVLLTPVAFFFRLIGRDVLHLGPPQTDASLWLPKPGAADPRRYFRQF